VTSSVHPLNPHSRSRNSTFPAGIKPFSETFTGYEGKTYHRYCDFLSWAATVMGIGLVVVREEKKKNAREMTLKVNTKPSLKAGKEKIQPSQLAVDTLVNVVVDKAFKAVAIKIENEES
jgi:hypothetical protein